MAWQAERSTTLELPLEEVLQRLGRQEAVEGVVLIGSASKGTLTAASDLDLLVVLREASLPLHVGVTMLAGRISDIIFTTGEEVEALLTLEEADRNSWQGRLLDWFASGTPVVDRFGRLAQLQEKARIIRFEAGSTGEGDRYALWFSINYNVQQTQRMAAAGDPIYDMAVDLRLLYCLDEVWTGYFAARQLPWRGEKEAIRVLAELDPAFLMALQATLGEPQRGRKVQRYAELAAAALEPLGGLWESGSTAFQFHNAAWQAGCDRKAREYWENLIGMPAVYVTSCD